MPELSDWEVTKIAQTREVLDVIESNASALKVNPTIDYMGQGSAYYYDYTPDSPTDDYPAIVAKVDMAHDLRVLRRDSRVIETVKDYQGDMFTITLTLLTGGKIRFSSSRKAVCTPTVVGTETVEERDYDAAPMKTVTRDVIQWDCSPLLDA